MREDVIVKMVNLEVLMLAKSKNVTFCVRDSKLQCIRPLLDDLQPTLGFPQHPQQI